MPGTQVSRLQAFKKRSIHVRSGCPVGESFIVDLVANHGRVALEVADDLANHALSVLTKIRI
jgi:hypothetical protein